MITPKTSYLIFIVVSTMAIGAQVSSAGDQQTATIRAKASQQAEKKPVRLHAVKVQPVTLDHGIKLIQQNADYQRIQSALESGASGRVEMSLILEPGQTAGESCICAGGKGELNGKPVDWPCDCSPAGCGTCGGSTLTSE
jgi:hypothetical protein